MKIKCNSRLTKSEEQTKTKQYQIQINYYYTNIENRSHRGKAGSCDGGSDRGCCLFSASALASPYSVARGVARGGGHG